MSDIPSKDEYSDEAVKRICAHMNEDHFISIYAMAKSKIQLKPGWKLTDAKLKSVSPSGCKIQAITCSGDMCEAQSVDYPFANAPISQAQLRSCLVAIHHQEMCPKLSWTTKPLALGLVAVLLFSVWVTLFADSEKLDTTMDTLTKENLGFTLPIPLSTGLARVIYLTAIAHAMEVAFVAYFAYKYLRFSPSTIAQWSILVFILGIPITNEFVDLLTFFRKKVKEQKAAAKKT